MPFAFPNTCYYASLSSCAEVPCRECVDNSMGVPASHGPCSILSSAGLRHNRNTERGYNNPSPCYNSVICTSRLAMDATTIHSRKTSLPLHSGQRTHRSYQAVLLHSAELRIRWAEAERFRCLHLPLPWLAEERKLPMPKELSLKVTFSFCFLLCQVT